MLERYKRAGGMKELVKLLESSPDSKKQKLMELIRAEDANFSLQVEARLLTWDHLKNAKPEILAEIIGLGPIPIVARAIVGEPEELLKFCDRCVKSFSEFKEAKEANQNTPPTAEQKAAAQRKLLEIAREVEIKNNVQIIPDSVIQQYITQAGGSVEISKLDKLSQGASTNSGSAGEDGTPTIDSFQMTEPPPGLSGERLTQYFKNILEK